MTGPRVGAWLTQRRTAAGSLTDPLLLHLLFVTLVLLRLAVDPPRPDATALGALVLVLPTLGAVGICAGRVGASRAIVLPLADLLAAGVLWPPPATAGIAVAVPALWLGLHFGRRGVATTLVATSLGQVLGSVVLPGPATWAGVTQSLQVVLGAVAVAGAVALAHSRLTQALHDVEVQRRLTETVADSVDVGLLEIDATGRYRSINRQHEYFMSLTSPAGHPRAVGERGYLFAADGVTPLASGDAPTARAARGERLRDELVWVGPDPAKRRGLHVSSAPRFSPDGAFVGTVLVFKDVTELMRALRVKDEFVASVSHELRTPLTSIVGYVEVILEDTDGVPDDVRRHLGTVQRSSQRLRRLVDDLLSTAHQSMSSATEADRVALPELLRLSTEELSRPATENGVSLHLTAGPRHEDLVVAGDAQRLGQVVDNLLSNAIKYTAAGGWVRAELLRDGDDALLRVSDSGRGIAPGDVEQIFTAFFRSADVHADAIPGVGLGLAITRQIVEAHGGRIEVSSELGTGTTVEVRLPLADAVSAAA